jgi:DNA-binding SARP family transcriptional activator
MPDEDRREGLSKGWRDAGVSSRRCDTQPVRLRVYLTGRMWLVAGDTLVGERNLPGRQGRLLLAYLVLSEHPSDRDDLAGLLWPNRLPRSSERSLTSLLSKLRAALGQLACQPPLTLRSTLGSCQLRLPTDSWVDVTAAADAITRAEHAVRSGDLEAADGWAQVAWQISRRPFLPGDPSDWAESVRDRLRSIRLRALDCNAAVDAVSGDTELAIHSAREALSLDPLRESSLRHLMRTLARANRHGEALRAYDTFRRTLAEQLGASPSPETQAVHFSILRHEST